MYIYAVVKHQKVHVAYTMYMYINTTSNIKTPVVHHSTNSSLVSLLTTGGSGLVLMQD